MDIAYRILVDRAFLRTALRRYNRQPPDRKRNAAMVAIAVAVLVLTAGAWLYASLTQATWLKFAEVAGGSALWGGMVVGWRILFFGTTLARQIRSNPAFGDEVSIVLNDQGLTETGPHARVKIEWSDFTRCVRLSDGVMLSQGSGARWLPHAGLQAETSEKAVAFVRSKVDLIDVV
jgi:hypothetical protein